MFLLLASVFLLYAIARLVLSPRVAALPIKASDVPTMLADGFLATTNRGLIVHDPFDVTLTVCDCYHTQQSFNFE